MSNIIDFVEARRQLRPSVQSHPRTIYELSLEERLYGDRLPFVSGLPTQFLSGDWP